MISGYEEVRGHGPRSLFLPSGALSFLVLSGRSFVFVNAPFWQMQLSALNSPTTAEEEQKLDAGLDRE
jgi:hypothetical protein